ncbi:MAG TPA: sn-glycerol-3-phosphate ABC transporter ATP-binding protein UgpC [Devosia sp.]|jgi:multiple sugar transport system ATP-binding protein|uniref:ABC transporter ATP-binding protein n=1 Tax=Devosia sp. TaxID=1871048 RepID=UPI002F93D194
MIKLSGVRKSFGAVEVIQGVDIEVEDGEFTVFVGPSGCGKSTLLRMIAGLESIDGGDLILNGKRINDVPPDQRGIAMVFQSYALYPHMTVGQNIGFSLDLKKVPKAEIAREVGRVAELLQLSDLLDRRPAELSGGQRQRVAIGRAIIKRPRVILFDEPLSNLDAALRVQMRAELQNLHQELRPTIVYVTHDQIEAMTMATRIVVLNKGKVEQWDTPIALYTDPVNTFVASFIGSPRMNLVSGSIAGDTAGQVFKADAGWTARLDGHSVAGAIGQRATLGIRPEDIRPVDDVAQADLSGAIAIVERLGAETYLNVRDGQDTLLVRAQGDLALSPGAPVQLALNHSAFHLFDQSGRVIAA